MLEGTFEMDLVPTLVVQSCCEYVVATTSSLKSASRDRKTINGCMLSAQTERYLAGVVRLRRRS